VEIDSEILFLTLLIASPDSLNRPFKRLVNRCRYMQRDFLFFQRQWPISACATQVS